MHRFQESEAAAGEFLRPGMRPLDVNQPASRPTTPGIDPYPTAEPFRSGIRWNRSGHTAYRSAGQLTQDKLDPKGPCGFGLRHRRAMGWG
jgi:hypothetical protein